MLTQLLSRFKTRDAALLVTVCRCTHGRVTKSDPATKPLEGLGCLRRSSQAQTTSPSPAGRWVQLPARPRTLPGGRGPPKRRRCERTGPCALRPGAPLPAGLTKRVYPEPRAPMKNHGPAGLGQ